MSDNIPWDIQTCIMKKLPVKSLIRFRCVSKQWKSLIDSSKFIKSYQAMNHHLLLRRHSIVEVHSSKTEFFSIIDNNNVTFPQLKSPITVTLPVNIRGYNIVPDHPGRIVESSHGLICFYDFHLDKSDDDELSELIVLWNPSIRKSVGIFIPGKQPRVYDAEYLSQLKRSWFGFGVCPETKDPKIVRIKTIQGTPDGYWKVEVYTLSSKVWKKVSVKPPCKSRAFRTCAGVSAKGFIYWLMYGESNSTVKSNLIASFDLTNEEFGQVYLPECLLCVQHLRLCKRNDCLTVLEYDSPNDRAVKVCNVWMMKDDDVTKSFTKMFTINLTGRLWKDVLEFRKNGDTIIETIEDGGNSILQVYDPILGRIVGDMEMDGIYYSLQIRSYTETLLLLDE